MDSGVGSFALRRAYALDLRRGWGDVIADSVLVDPCLGGGTGLVGKPSSLFLASVSFSNARDAAASCSARLR